MTIEKRCSYLHYWNICGETFQASFKEEKTKQELMQYLIDNLVAVDVDEADNNILLFYKTPDVATGRRGSGNIDFWFELPNVFDIVLDTRIEERYCPEGQISPKEILALYRNHMK